MTVLIGRVVGLLRSREDVFLWIRLAGKGNHSEAFVLFIFSLAQSARHNNLNKEFTQSYISKIVNTIFVRYLIFALRSS